MLRSDFSRIFKDNAAMGTAAGFGELQESDLVVVRHATVGESEQTASSVGGTAGRCPSSHHRPVATGGTTSPSPSLA